MKKRILVCLAFRTYSGLRKRCSTFRACPKISANFKGLAFKAGHKQPEEKKDGSLLLPLLWAPDLSKTPKRVPNLLVQCHYLTVHRLQSTCASKCLLRVNSTLTPKERNSKAKKHVSCEFSGFSQPRTTRSLSTVYHT